MTIDEEIIVAQAACTLRGREYDVNALGFAFLASWHLPLGYREILGNFRGLRAVCDSRGIKFLPMYRVGADRVGIVVTLLDYVKLTDLIQAVAHVEGNRP